MDPRVAAEAIWQAALAAGDVGPLLRRSFQRRGDIVQVGDRAVDLSRIDRVFVLGCGKAGAAMALAVEDILGDRISAGFVVVKDGHLAATRASSLPKPAIRCRMRAARRPPAVSWSWPRAPLPMTWSFSSCRAAGQP